MDGLLVEKKRMCPVWFEKKIERRRIMVWCVSVQAKNVDIQALQLRETKAKIFRNG